MALIIFLLAPLLIFLGIQKLKTNIYSILATALIFSFLIYLSSLILSQLHYFNYRGVMSFWLLTNFFICFLYHKKKIDLRFKKSVQTYLFSDKIILLFIAIVAIHTFSTGIFSPPNSWDSMTYHLSRIRSWIQNCSVFPYPTNCIRQITFPAIAEYGISHIMLLSGSDRLAFLVQWASYIGCIIATMGICISIGLSKSNAIKSGLITALIPMAILQSSSSQNDLVISFFILSFNFFILDKWENLRDRSCLLFSTLSCALAIQTKGTAYFLLFPSMIFFIFINIHTKFIDKFKFMAIIGFSSILINLPMYFQNYQLLKTPLTSPDFFSSISNSKISFKGFFSNAIRSSALHFRTRFIPLNKFIVSKVNKFHDFMNIKSDDPDFTMRTLTSNREFKLSHYLITHEEQAGNPHHMLFYIICIILGFKIIIKNSKILWLFSGILASASLSCLILKWNPYVVRYHLVWFMIFAPLSIHFSSSYLKFQTIILIIFSLLSFLWIYQNLSRKLIGENNIFSYPTESLYFVNRTSLQKPYFNLIDKLNDLKPKNIGLSLFSEDWEYPIWALLDLHGTFRFNIQHIKQNHVFYPLSFLDVFVPDCIITTRYNGTEMQYNKLKYNNIWNYKPLFIYQKDNKNL